MTAQINWPEVIAGILGGGGGSQLWSWLSRRGRDRAYIQGAVEASLREALGGVSNQLERADKRLTDMERHRDECEAELELGRRERVDLQRQLDELMSGPVAGYEPRVPKT